MAIWSELGLFTDSSSLILGLNQSLPSKAIDRSPDVTVSHNESNHVTTKQMAFPFVLI